MGIFNWREALEIIGKVFLEEKAKISKELIDAYFKFDKSDDIIKEGQCFDILEYIFYDDVIEFPEEKYNKLICCGIKTNINKSREFVKKILEDDSNKKTEMFLIIYSKNIPIIKFAEFTSMEYNMCSLLVTIRQEFAICDEIWKKNKGFQQGIIGCLDKKKCNQALIQNICETILGISKYDLCNELYNIFQIECVTYLITYILEKNTKDSLNSKSILKISKINSDVCIEQVKNKFGKKLEYNIMIFRMIDPYKVSLSKSNLDFFIKLYQYISIDELTKEDRFEIANFLLPLILRADILFPNQIVSFSFGIVNEKLASQSYLNDEWRKMEELLPDVAWYNNWDRCKRLKKGLKKKGYSFKALESNDLEIHLL